ncbi:hypothetical protein HYY73_01985 [Candidatus Woesearchaeota archaeon]|nr:hypothetical protein [Candidatus Woesearchaeota archaeon]
MNNRDKIFFLSYQPDSLMEKAIILKRIIEHPEILDNVKDKFSLHEPKAVINNLKAELHFAMYHILENLFALCIAQFKSPDDIWSWMSHYDFSELNAMIAQIARRGIGVISGVNNAKTVRALFFAACPSHFLKLKRTKRYIENISLLLKHFAIELSDKEVYNSYKHGLRIIKGNLNIKKTYEVLGDWSAFFYFNKYEPNKGDLILKSYSYEQSFRIIELAWQLTRLLIWQRKAKIGVVVNMKFYRFDRINIKEVFDKSKIPAPMGLKLR